MLDYRFYVQNNEEDVPEEEREILAKLESGMTVDDILAGEERWTVFCRLSAIRENLLEWYPFEKTASVLQIGADCGALTGLLCEKTQSVDVLESSVTNAKIADIRNRDRHNLQIFPCSLKDFSPENKYDYIVMAGSFPYCRRFWQSDDPQKDVLDRLKEYLTPGGCLILATENRFGLKYWSGAREDHTARYYEGIEDYGHAKDVQTFSKPELTRLLHASGYHGLKFYYPLPDYKCLRSFFLRTICLRQVN